MLFGGLVGGIGRPEGSGGAEEDLESTSGTGLDGWIEAFVELFTGRSS